MSNKYQAGILPPLESTQEDIERGSREYTRHNSSLAEREVALKYFIRERQLLALISELEAATKVLEMIYDKYEEGTSCYEDPDDCAGYVGNAVRLSGEEEDSILAVFEAAGIPTALTFSKRMLPAPTSSSEREG